MTSGDRLGGRLEVKRLRLGMHDVKQSLVWLCSRSRQDSLQTTDDSLSPIQSGGVWEVDGVVNVAPIRNKVLRLWLSRELLASLKNIVKSRKSWLS